MCFAHQGANETRLRSALTGSMLPTTCPRTKWQRVSSEDRRTPVWLHARFVFGHVDQVTQVVDFCTLSRQSEVHVPTDTVL